MLFCLCSSGSTVLRYNIKHVHLGTDVSTFTQNDVISHVPEYLILSSKYSWYRIWKEFYLSRNPRNGGDVLAKDVDGHQGGELYKKLSLSPKKILAWLDTKNQTSCTGSFSCHMGQTFKRENCNKNIFNSAAGQQDYFCSYHFLEEKTVWEILCYVKQNWVRKFADLVN